ncbi:hypothetical protein [Gordonia effusa]|uniref:hypothetical protein n=1 Tax=Gordonia effusa TaxID=263908 RepID=UPI00058C69D9|nr:hypothetical protein [Gordonia effusa]
MDHAIDYFFGTGDGSVSHWHSPADADLDHDGRNDAVRLDFDGDGRADDAMWDSDGDGVADIAALDRDDDGTPDSFYRDSGRGLWDVAAFARRLYLDIDGDGRDDCVLTDRDGDGVADAGEHL